MGVVMARLHHNPLSEQLTQLPQEEQTVPGRSELVGAKYEGVDEQGQPFTVTADRAVRVLGDAADAGDLSRLDAETVDLVRPRAELKLPEGRALSLSAHEGRFAQGDARLDLKGGVTLEDGRGNALWIDRVDVDLDGNALVADTPVRGEGPDGRIDAEGLRLEDGGNTIIFTGRATLTLPGREGDTAP
jgi:lipopolysaccharide export system protein LptC